VSGRKGEVGSRDSAARLLGDRVIGALFGVTDHVIRGGRRAGGVLVAGDRPYLATLVAICALAALMISAPLNRYLDGRERIALLEHQHGALEDEIRTLEQRAEDLHDPEHIELLAREQLGLVRPGEIPYVVVQPEVERPQLVAPPDEPPEPDAWHRRLIEALKDAVS
jgi:cell division protein FtsB